MSRAVKKLLRLRALLALACVACTGTGSDTRDLLAPFDEAAFPTAARIRSAQDVLQHEPYEAATWADLGAAWFEAARATLDPVAVRRARDAFTRSQSLAETDRAAENLALLALFRQRFADASRRFDALRARHPDDTELLPRAVEAALGSGDVARAEELIALAPRSESDPRVREAGALLRRERGDLSGAACELLAASALARPASELEAERLALAAAAVYLEAGDATNAARLLVPFESAPPARADAEILLAELAFAGRANTQGALRAQLERCETLLARQVTNPRLHAAAARLARALHDDERAETHVLAAEDGFTRVQETSETYTLGDLANLYAIGDDDLDRALEFARKHARAVHDRGARARIEELELRRTRHLRARRDG